MGALLGEVTNGLLPAVGAMIFGAVGWNALFGVYGVAFLVAASMWLFIDPRRTFYAGTELGTAEPPGFEVLPAAGPAGNGEPALAGQALTPKPACD